MYDVGMLRLIGLYMHAGNKYVCSLNLLQHFDVKNKQTNEDLLLLHFLFQPQQTTTVKYHIQGYENVECSIEKYSPRRPQLAHA